jgi:hypothetical protein
MLIIEEQRKKLEQMNNEEITPDLDKAQLLVPVFGLESLDNSTYDDNSTEGYYYYYYDDYYYDDANSTNTTKPETTVNTNNVTKTRVAKKNMANADFAK